MCDIEYKNTEYIQVFITSADPLLLSTENLKYRFLNFGHLSRKLLIDDKSIEKYGYDV